VAIITRMGESTSTAAWLVNTDMKSTPDGDARRTSRRR
jgi:hypothetical protein